MAPSLVALDTNAIIFLVSDPSRDAAVERKRQAVRFALEEFEREGCQVVVPTPVVAELGTGLHTPRERIRLLRKQVGKMRMLSLTKEAAEVANEMARAALAKKPSGAERLIIKYDILIAAIAHQFRVKYLLTDNVRDYRSPLAEVHSSVIVWDATSPPNQGQANIYHIKPAT